MKRNDKHTPDTTKYAATVLLCLLAATLALSACSKDDDDPVLDTWKAANEKAFDAISRNPEYTELKSPGNNGSIYYRILRKGDGIKPIYYTSRVLVYYKGWFVAANETLKIANGQVFDRKLFDDGVPATFAVSYAGSTYDDYTRTYNPRVPIEGWTIALQHMVKGDKWEVVIPFHLGYGEKKRRIRPQLFNAGL